MKDKLILTDCDGVLAHWEWNFDQWMAKHGFVKQQNDVYRIHESYNIPKAEGERLIRMFNESVYIRYLAPYRDAIKYVKTLHEDYGCVFHVITSIGDEHEVVDSRTHNLYNLFGKSCFYKITCLPPDISKEYALIEYKDSGLLWIEDHENNFKLGEKLGLNSCLMSHSYNKHVVTENRVRSWADVFSIYKNTQNFPGWSY